MNLRESIKSLPRHRKSNALNIINSNPKLKFFAQNVRGDIWGYQSNARYDHNEQEWFEINKPKKPNRVLSLVKRSDDYTETVLNRDEMIELLEVEND